MLLKTAKKVIVAVIGTTILLLGLIMLPAPGPGMPVVIAGLAILGVEFVWARLLLKRLKRTAHDMYDRVKTSLGQDPPKDTK
jgi:tellurite resistance protein TerC